MPLKAGIPVLQGGEDVKKHNDLENTARLAEFSRNRSAETRKKMSNSAKARPRARNDMGQFYVG